MPTKTLALLIDGDNAQFQYLKQIIQFCKVFGTLDTKNAYGDWKQLPLSVHREILKAHDVTEMQQDRIVPNATDMALAMDVRSMLDKREVDIYFIVSRDRDFTVVCDQILKTRAKVIGIGSEKNASVQLQNACTLFFDLDEIVKNQSKSPAKTKSKKLEATLKKQSVASTKPAVATPSKNRLKKLVEAYEKTPRKDEYGWILIAQIGQTLRQVDTAFKQRFAGKKLSGWLKAFPDKFDVKDHYVRMK